MLKFYRDALFSFLVLLLCTGLLIYAGLVKSRLNTSLFPARDDDLLWAAAIEPPSPLGKTQVDVKSDVGTIEYEFFLDGDQPYPYTHYTLYFVDAVQPYKRVDLTPYSSIAFRIICDPKNVLLFVLFSFDEKVTDLNNAMTRRVSSTAFSCDNHWATVDIRFDDLDTPDWWLGRNGYDYSESGYPLDKTMGFAWVNSLQSPLNQASHVKLTDIKLLGTDSRYLYGAGVLCILLWVLFFIWQFRRYVLMLTDELRSKVKRDLPLIAYKKLSIEPQRDKEKSAVVRYMATEYANPELSLDSAVTALGINRTKINDILKEELGLTFTAYLNKLRLTEAARLLAEKADASISEIAYSVGYNNVSYFNRLFKSEYGCAPKTFKSLYVSSDPE